MKLYNKLVRDKIPTIITTGENPKICEIERLSDEEVMEWLYNKLLEETDELITDRNIEEMADVIEVVLAIASKYGYTEKDVFDEIYRKRKEKGGFEENIILRKVYDKCNKINN